jgi:sodium-dependent dicarboxylate transporter 2/3/5
MALTLPLFAVMGLVLFGLLIVLNPAQARHQPSRDDLRQYLDRQRDALGPWTAGQINTLFAFAVAVTLWMLPGFVSLVTDGQDPLSEFLNHRFPEAVVALIAAGLLFMLPVDWRRGEFTIRWEDAVQIDWGTLLLFGGGLSLGTLMFQTGVAEALGRSVVASTGADSLWGLTAASIVLGIVLSEVSSNTASANMVIPVAIALAQAAGVSPIPPALGACLGSSYGFMLPVSTPPNAIVYGTGLVPITRMLRAGILFDVLGFAIIFVGLRILCPWLGLM